MMRIVIGITGASGSVLAERTIAYLSACEHELNIVITENGAKVFAYETGRTLPDFLKILSGPARVILHDNADLFSSIASGSNAPDAMIILPCSMATLGKLASVTGENLLCRAADCCLKERARLIICPRETPLHSAHIRNMLTLSEMGAVIVPPMPLFYTNPRGITEVTDGIVGRVLKSAGISNTLYDRWGGK